LFFNEKFNNYFFFEKAVHKKIQKFLYHKIILETIICHLLLYIYFFKTIFKCHKHFLAKKLNRELANAKMGKLVGKIDQL
jgi:hypothetical protein